MFWRLLVNGVAAAGGHDVCPRGPCPCGWVPDRQGDRLPDWSCLVGAPALRVHYFWDCPVAQAVLQEIARALPVGLPLHRWHVWCLFSPSPVVCPAVWVVVCLSALSAMDRGRRTFWHMHLSGRVQAASGGLRQQTLYEAWGLDTPPEPDVLPASPVQKAAGVAVAAFWSGLQNFVALQNTAASPEVTRVRSWRGSGLVAQGHPFIEALPGVPRRFRVILP